MRTLKGTSPYLSWMVYSSLTNRVSATAALSPIFLSPLCFLLELLLILFVLEY